MKTIRTLREEAKLTQLELGNAIGVTPVTVYNWERGKYEPKASQLRSLARVLRIPMDDIDFEGPMKDRRSNKSDSTGSSSD